jgi:hypothetical protein
MTTEMKRGKSKLADRGLFDLLRQFVDHFVFKRVDLFGTSGLGRARRRKLNSARRIEALRVG